WLPDVASGCKRQTAGKSHLLESPSTPGQVPIAEGQVTIALPGDLEDGIGNTGLYRGAAVVTHATQPMPGLEESDVDLRRILFDARQRESVRSCSPQSGVR